MADQEQIERLKAGVKEWNVWRRGGELRTRVDLSGADLTEAKLMLEADLAFADLSGANLSGVNLTEADLREANLSGADLRETILLWADLRGAGLDGANLTHADLRQSNLTEADLTEANLSEALLSGTLFGNASLLNTRGLDSCRYLGPSFLDHRTLMQSGSLPLAFLRGCGLPDSLIDYLPSLLDAAVQFYSCFISYSTRDQEFATRLYADLQNNGVRCWFAPHDIQSGKKIHEQIDQAIHLYDRVLLILSEHSMDSEWVKTEIAYARQKELNQNRRVLFPISVVPFEKLKAWKCFDADIGKDSAREIREYFIPDFSNWKHHGAFIQAFERLLKDLRLDKAE